MKVGACGAASTGKTATMNFLSELMGIPLIPSKNREVFAEQGIVECDQHTMTPQDVFELQNKLFWTREEQEKEITQGLFDVTLLDHYIYTLYRSGSFLSAEYVQFVFEKMVRSLHTYDQILYFPMKEFHGGEADGLREVGLGHNLLIDAAIHGVLLDEVPHRHWAVGKGTPEERALRIQARFAQ